MRTKRDLALALVALTSLSGCARTAFMMPDEAHAEFKRRCIEPNLKGDAFSRCTEENKDLIGLAFGPSRVSTPG